MGTQSGGGLFAAGSGPVGLEGGFLKLELFDPARRIWEQRSDAES
jgi:hypothetical protein